jgi:hypothetical protein
MSTPDVPEILADLPAGKRWLTVPEVCAWLGITEADWSAWRAAGTAPHHATGTGGQARVWVRHLERWLDTLEALPEATEAATPDSEDDGGDLAPVVPIDHARRRRDGRPGARRAKGAPTA